MTPVDSPSPLLPPLLLDSSAIGVAIDVESGDDVSSSVVLVVSPGGTGTVIDDHGHVLTNWHVVKESPSVLVIPKKRGEARPDEDQILLARVVRLNRFADLALPQVLAPWRWRWRPSR